MPAFSDPTLDPSLRFGGRDESQLTPYDTEPFGIGTFGRLAHGLVGLDPRIIQDPRFNYNAFYDMQQAKPRMGPPGREIGTSFMSHPTMLVDLDPKTVANDMWAIAQGHKGTSVGDVSSKMFTNLTKDIVGGSHVITPAMVNELKLRLMENRYPEMRQQHPGKEAYTEKK